MTEPRFPLTARTPQVITVGVVLLLEALAALGFGVLSLTQVGQPGPLNLPGRIFLIVIALGAAAWQVRVAVQFLRGQAWTRAAIVVWQVFQVIVAVPMLSPENGTTTAALGWLLLVPAAVALLCLFSRSTTEHLAATEKRG